MPINGVYGGNADNVTDHGAVAGWADQSGVAYGTYIALRRSYCFGPVVNGWGTWGQLIYDAPNNLSGQDHTNPTGLNGAMPANPAPGNSFWIQGHLVNGECGGDGALAANLTPISHNINMLHKGHEAALQRLINRGQMNGSIIRSFNPNGIVNSRVIYRTHRLAPPAGTYLGMPPHPFALVPNGIAISLGIVINGAMQSAADIATEFANGVGVARWFSNTYYGNTLAIQAEQQRLLQMIGGVQIDHP